MLEITITHKIGPDEAELLSEDDSEEMLRRRWIVTGTEGLGPSPENYPPGRARQAIELFAAMARDGAAVVASFPAVRGWPKQYRVVGLVERDSQILRHGRLICLSLHDPRVFDASTSFLGNAPARQCTLQRCDNRTLGRLAALAQRKSLPRDASALHHHDVE